MHRSRARNNDEVKASGRTAGSSVRRGAHAARAPELRSDQMLREVLEGLSVGVAMATRTGTILYANSSFTSEMGIPAYQEVIGSHLHNYVAPEGWKALKAALEGAVYGPTEGELRIETASSRPKTLRLSLSPLQTGSAAQIQIVTSDITEFAAAHEILRKTEASLHSLSGRILRVQDEERRRIARDLHDTTGQELAMVVMSLTHLAKNLEQPGLDIRKAIVDATKMVRNVEQEVRTLSYLLHPPLLDELGLASALRWYVEGFNKRSGIHTTLDLPTELGRLSPEKETALFRVVQESLTNVLRHSGSSTAQIEVLETAGQVAVSVEDEGKGIDGNLLGKITNGKEMMGVGLAGIRERLLQFGGELSIHSGPLGTRVVASVPSLESDVAEKAANYFAEATRERAPHGRAGNSTRKRILVVDDHEVMRQGIRALLAVHEDLEVCGEAQDGLEAVLKTKELKPDLIVMDLTMPNVGGLSATYRIRQLEFGTKILMFTTHKFDGLERMVRGAGCDGMVLKANASQDLIHAVQDVLRGRQFFSSERARTKTGSS